MTNRQTPFFSIAVPTYQRPALLRECLRSILGQSFPDFEILIGNNDPAHPLTPSALGFSDSRIRILNRPQNIGALANIMELLYAVEGRYVTWLADDDLYLSPNFLETLHRGIQQFAFPKVLFTSYQQKSTPDFTVGSPSSQWVSLKPEEYLHQALQSKIEIIGNYGMWEREALVKLGGMKRLGTGYSPYTDTLLGFEAAYSEKILFLNQPLIFFRAHEESRSWTSEDLSGYATAQMDMVAHFLRLTDTLKEYPTRDQDLYRLLRNWCVGFFGAVAARSKSPQLGVWPSYFSWVLKVSGHLPGRFRVALMFRVAREILRVLWRRTKRRLRSAK